MLNRLALCLMVTAFAVCVPVAAQARVQTQTQAPDNDAIASEVRDPSSRHYYPALILRYERGDSTLTAEDYRMLYYGYAFQEEYRPLEAVPAEDAILAIFEANAEPGPEDAEAILSHARVVMRHDPFSPRNINFMTYAYGILGDTVSAKVSAARLEGVMGAIESSGSGAKEESPWHVLRFSHVNDFMGARNVDIRKRVVVSRSVEVVLPPGASGGERYYFDFSRVYLKPPDNRNERKSEMKFGHFNDSPAGLINR